MSSLDTFSTPPPANPRWIGNLIPQQGVANLLADTISTYSTGTVVITDAVLNGTIAGDVLGAPNGLATLDSTGVVPASQLPIGAALIGYTTPTNTFLGVNCGSAAPAGSLNSGIGVGSLQSLTTGLRNTASGTLSLNTLVNGNDNTASGYNTLAGNVAGIQNVAMGSLTMQTGTHTSCVGIGYNVSSAAGGFNNSVAIGANATWLDSSAVAVGSGATASTSGVVIGFNAGDPAAAGSDNVLIGPNAGGSNFAGSFNVAVGSNAFVANIGGNDAVAIGYLALGGSTVPDQCVAVGRSALNAFTAGTGPSVAVGYFSQRLLTAGGQNTSVGTATMAIAGTYVNCCAFGHNALASNTGNRNIGIGNAALSQATTDDSVAVGSNALAAMNTGQQNVAVGSTCMITLTNGSNNTAMGYRAARLAAGASNLTAIGNQALENVTSGGSNSALGANTGAAIVAGTGNVFIGVGANATGDFSNAVAIGQNASVGASDTVRVGTAGMSYEIFGAWTNVSDARLKRDVVDIDDARIVDFVQALQPRKFNMKVQKYSHELGMNYGFIAQELRDAMEATGFDDFGGYQYNPGSDLHQIRYDAFHGITIKTLQILLARIEALERRLAKNE